MTEVIINGIKYVPEKEEKKPYVIEINKRLEIYPHDMPKTMTYVDSEKAVASLGDGWRIPTLDELRLMYKHKEKIGMVSDNFYWSCTEDCDHPYSAYHVRFSDGEADWNHKACIRLSCRPVRTLP